IDDLLELSRVTRTDLRRQRVDLTVLARAIAAELERTAPGRAVRWLIGEGLVADGDAQLLRVVFENLLGNAWKFTAKVAQPIIEVGSLSSDRQTIFFV